MIHKTTYKYFYLVHKYKFSGVLSDDDIVFITDDFNEFLNAFNQYDYIGQIRCWTPNDTSESYPAHDVFNKSSCVKRISFPLSCDMDPDFISRALLAVSIGCVFTVDYSSASLNPQHDIYIQCFYVGVSKVADFCRDGLVSEFKIVSNGDYDDEESIEIVTIDVPWFVNYLDAVDYCKKRSIEYINERLKRITLSEHEDLVLYASDDSFNMWYEYHEGSGCFQYAYVEHEDILNYAKYIDEALANYHQGRIQCSYCGKWIPISDAHHICPAGCSCDDCFEHAHENELDFLSNLD